MTSEPAPAASDDALHGEEAIIQQYLSPLAAGWPGAYGLTDDCATITPTPGHDLVVKTDPVAAGIHFLADDPPEDIGWRALAVNVSDLAAKAAVPRAYLMALSFPEPPTRAWMRRFAMGLGEAQAAFGMHLVGGDTDRRPGPITISITVFGEVSSGRMVRRGTARAGDGLYVTGGLGSGAIGLALIQDPSRAAEWGLSAEEAAHAIARFRRPAPRLAMRDALLAYASAAMDISDGLAKDLGRMCRASGTGAAVELERVPREAAAAAAVRADPRRWHDVVAAGDDYEVLLTVPPERAAAFEAAAVMAGAAADPPFPVTRIGTMTLQPGLVLSDAEGRAFVPSKTGWDHF
ncbi:MAG: thiamine-phosphate kinase [Hyphomicrobiaceae bacterium]